MYSGQVIKRGTRLAPSWIRYRWRGKVLVWVGHERRYVRTELGFYQGGENEAYMVALAGDGGPHHIGTVYRQGAGNSWGAVGGIAPARYESKEEAAIALASDYLSRMAARIRELQEREAERLGEAGSAA